MKLWLALFAVLPLVAVSAGSSATAGSTAPPRNGLIAVGAAKGLHIVDPRTGRGALLPGGAQMSNPAWSPDGELLAVTQWDEARPGVYTVKPDGSELTLVLDRGMYPSWSPDGKSLAAVRDDPFGDEGTSALVIVKADGTDQRELAVEGTQYIDQPEWSPDGKRIAFVDGAGHIRLVTPEGKTVSIYRDREAGNLSWSPDSSMLAFDAFEKSADKQAMSRQIIVVRDIATGKESILRGRQDGAGSPVWSPDGKQIAFLSLVGKAEVMTGGCGDGNHYVSHLWAMAADGTGSHRLAKGSYYGAPAWARSLEPAPAD